MLVWCIACSSLQLLGFNLSDLCLSFGYLFYCINHYFCCSFKFFYWTLVCVSVWMQPSLPISDVIQQNSAFSWCWVVKWVWYLCWFILLFMYVCRVILSILTVNMACNIILSESAFLNQLDAALVLLQGWYTFTCTNCCCVITCYSYLFLNLCMELPKVCVWFYTSCVNYSLHRHFLFCLLILHLLLQPCFVCNNHYQPTIFFFVCNKS